MKHTVSHFVRLLVAALLVGLSGLVQAQQYTSPEGFRVLVAPRWEGKLHRQMRLADQRFKGSTFSFAIPANAFVHGNKDAIVTLEATQANGKPLPSWVNFNPKTGVFSGSIARSSDMVFIKIVVKDNVSPTQIHDDFTLSIQNY